jgi:hypothetical protein
VVVVEMMAAPAEMAAQAVLVEMAALAASRMAASRMAASRMAAIRLSVQGVAAWGEDWMSAWLAGPAVLPARGVATQVGYKANLAYLAVVDRMSVANRKTVVEEAKARRLLMAVAKALKTECKWVR